MQNEGWPERLGWLIGGTVTLGIGFALAGLVWSLALGFALSKGALWGGVAGVTIGFLIALGPACFGSRLLAGGKGMMFMLGTLLIPTVIIGLLVWLIRALVG